MTTPLPSRPPLGAHEKVRVNTENPRNPKGDHDRFERMNLVLPRQLAKEI